jgi:hypothetical protein
MTPIELVQRVSPTIGSAGSAFYFAPATLARGKELGLDGFRFYALGRGGVLGDVEPAVIQSAFGYFNGGLIAKIWDSAKEVMSPREAGTVYMECAGNHGTANLADIAGLDEFNVAAEKVIAAADPSALALFAGVAAEAKSNDTAARAMQNVAVLRELRGSVHLVAIAAQGLSAEMAHRIKRPDDVATFGWGEGVEPSDAERAKWDAAEALTDELLAPVWAVLDDAEAAAVVTAVDAIGSALS